MTFFLSYIIIWAIAQEKRTKNPAAMLREEKTISFRNGDCKMEHNELTFYQNKKVLILGTGGTSRKGRLFVYAEVYQ